MNLNPYHTPYTKSNLKWIISLNVKTKIINISKEKIEKILANLG